MTQDYLGWFAYISIQHTATGIGVTWHDRRDTIKWLDLKTIGLDGVE